MAGLPKAKDDLRPREAFTIMVLDSVERMTMALRRGDAFSAQGLADMQALNRRLGAFSAALEYRMELVEEDNDQG